MRRGSHFTWRGTVVGPLAVGAAYAVGTHLPTGLGWQHVYWQSPLMFAFFSGVLIAFACRPVLSRLQLTRPLAALLGFLLVAGLGPLPGMVAARFSAVVAGAPYPLAYAQDWLPDLLGAAAAALVMTAVFCPPGGDQSLRTVGHLVGQHAGKVGRRLAALGGVVVAWQLAAGYLDTVFVWEWALYGTGVVQPNLWLRITTLGTPAAAATLLAAAWVQGVTLLVPLGVVGLILRATWQQLALVYAMLLFVIHSFAPLVVNQPYPSPLWLTLVVAGGVAQAAVLGGIAGVVWASLRQQLPD